ncbi:cation diffusion facilitator family transporter [Thalassorhabdomicrobium marinisediminis]|uniref:Cation transporter n=1 Tax=Thalassorhabdomicrobium marinisediminis TaxID=2170577 RepID=A0A2T7FZZ4_9RHOB|nr:cation diffusion facilitator family transporter [Thalassorhabdomicrobium marinisediminis]PVA07708.1 cation transporter [Thalassorhabdomicrobium marinisediminis]
MTDHSYGPGDHGHDHDHSHVPKNERKIAIAAVLTGGFMLAEVVGGVISGSLALIADAGHMLTDFASLVLAWFAIRLVRKPADWKRTYGFDRFSVLAALVNGLSLFAIAIWITFEAIQRLRDPHEVLGGLMLWVAIGGLLVNIIAFWILTRGESENLNVRAAALHVAGDLFGSIAAIVASVVIIYTGWTPIDPILSVLVVLIILRSAWAVVRESGHILLEGAPRGFDRREVAKVLKSEVSGITDVAHIHAWSVTQERPMVTMELTVAPSADPVQVKDAAKAILRDRFRIDHSTIEVV